MSQAALRLQAATELLTPEAMGAVDRWTIEAGTAGIVLMEHAGAAVADRARARWDGGRITVLCGPGNNGGDGFVAARLLRGWGFEVDVRLLGDRDRLRGDGAEAAAAWGGPVAPLGRPDLDGVGLLIDAVFGAGLARPLAADVALWADAAAEGAMKVLAVDLPSGVDGATGAIAGSAFQAIETVTFGRAKPGHYLLPGAQRCGRVVIAEIGLEEKAIRRAHRGMQQPLWRNLPALWSGGRAPRDATDHKYRRGHVTVVAGGIETGGAGRLSARAALAAGAGLVTLATPKAALMVHACHLEAVMVRAFDDGLDALLADERRNVWVVGPGVGSATRRHADAVLDAARATVLDADALTSFADETAALRDAIRGPTVLTPHAGEAQRLLPSDEGKLAHARRLADATGAVVVHKGFDSVVATPDGGAAIAVNGCPALATAGTGDVLTGVIAAQLAQGMSAFEAAAAGVWLHNQAAWSAPGSLTAERLVGQVRGRSVLANARAG